MKWFTGPDWLEEKLPFRAAGLNCPVARDVAPFKKRKVRILNGAHTGFALGAYLAGFDIVRDCMVDDMVRGFMNKMLSREVLPTLDVDGAEDFAAHAGDSSAELTRAAMKNTELWGRDLTEIPGFEEETVRVLERIERRGAYDVMARWYN